MAATDAILVGVVNLLVGTLAIWAGARLFIDESASIGRAAVVALVGALAWGLVSFFLGWLPVVGPLLALVAWVGVINLAYPGGWATATAVGVTAWLVAAAVLWALASFGIVTYGALGVPGM